MEEALFLTRYGSKCTSSTDGMSSEPAKLCKSEHLTFKIEVLYSHSTLEAYGNENGRLAGLKVQD